MFNFRKFREKIGIVKFKQLTIINLNLTISLKQDQQIHWLG